MTSLVSVVIPCHNAERWVGATLESVFAQTYPSIEAIVVDDGSSDGSTAVVTRYQRPNLRLVAQRNQGASAARNAGAAAATGQYIQFLDADDLLHPEKIARQVRALQSDGDRNALASAEWGRFTTDPEAAKFRDTAVFRDFDPVEYLLAHTQDAKMMHPAAWLVPRHLATAAGPWDERLSLNDDGEYFARVILAASRIVFVSGARSYYRSGLPGSLSRRRDRRALASLFQSAESITAHLLQRENSARVRQALADYWKRIGYELYPDDTALWAQAERRSKSFGRSVLHPPMGRRQQQLARVIGWRLVKRLARWLPR